MEAAVTVTGGQGSEDHECSESPERAGVQYRLLSDTRVISEYQSPCYISSICPTREGTAWTCDYVSDVVTLVDSKGRVCQEVSYPSCITDISLCPTTQQLWTCSEEDHSIMQLKPGAKPKLNFTTDNKPLSVCVTVDRHVIVGMPQNITKFTLKVVLTLSSVQPGKLSKTRKSVITSPVKLSLCPLTGNLAVVDQDVLGGNSHIVVLDREFRVVFRYRVYTPRGVACGAGQCSFDPRDVVYDLMGNIVICDYRNHSIHLLSGQGQYLRLIHTDTSATQTVGIDKANVLWIVTGVDKIKCLQYSEV